MKIEIDVDQALHLLWSHGDAIPKQVREHFANSLRNKLSENQLKAICKSWCEENNHMGKINETVGCGPEYLFDKITSYVTADTKIARYTDLARG